MYCVYLVCILPKHGHQSVVGAACRADAITDCSQVVWGPCLINYVLVQQLLGRCVCFDQYNNGPHEVIVSLTACMTYNSAMIGLGLVVRRCINADVRPLMAMNTRVMQQCSIARQGYDRLGLNI